MTRSLSTLCFDIAAYDVGVPAFLDARELRAYFALTEAVSLLQFAVQRQLRADGGLSYVQFEILAKLAEAERLTMTELADGVVYSRSGLTHQAGLLEKAGLITRTPSSDDQRATVVEITQEGRDRVAAVLPGHVRVVRELLFDGLSDADVDALGDMMTTARDHMRSLPSRSSVTRARHEASGGWRLHPE